MTLRIQKKEQQETSGMVAKQSQQMLELLKVKQEEARQELAQELVSLNKTVT